VHAAELAAAAAALLSSLFASAGAWRCGLAAGGARLGLGATVCRYGVGSLANTLAPARLGFSRSPLSTSREPSR